MGALAGGAADADAARLEDGDDGDEDADADADVETVGEEETVCAAAAAAVTFDDVGSDVEANDAAAVTVVEETPLEAEAARGDDGSVPGEGVGVCGGGAWSSTISETVCFGMLETASWSAAAVASLATDARHAAGAVGGALEDPA